MLLAGPSTFWSVNLAAGHDDQILADPEQLGVVRPVSDYFFSGSTRFLFRYTEIFKQDRFDLSADAKGTTYGQKVEGGDGDLTFLGAYRKRISSSLVIDLSGSSSLFRRSEKASEEPLFDFDLIRLDGRLGWSPGNDWLVTGTFIHDWINFPGRFADEDTAGVIIEEQSQVSTSLSGMRMFTRGQYLSGEIIYRRTTSNALASEFDGPIATVRGRGNLPEGLSLTGFLAFGSRSYDHFLTADSTDTRNDQTWQVGVTLDRQLSPRVTLFLDANYFNQLSNVEDFEFDQTRIAMGVAMTLVAVAETQFMLPPMSTLTPVVTGLGVRFRYRDPAAGSVALVGGFNGWDPTRHVLRRVSEDGLWEITAPLEAGIWRYAFVVDGEWRPPQEAPRYEDDGFGGRSGVMEVPVSQGDESVTDAEKRRHNR